MDLPVAIVMLYIGSLDRLSLFIKDCYSVIGRRLEIR